jgi:competence protein ComEA
MSIRRLVATGLALVLGLVFVAGPALAAAKPAPAGKVNLNAASVEQLSTLPGVGAKLAARIVEHRQKAGGFKTTQELLNVKGIGEKNFAKLQPFVTLGDAAGKAAASR